MRLIVVVFLGCLSLMRVTLSGAETHFVLGTWIAPPLVSSQNHPGFLDTLITEAFKRLGKTVDLLILPAERVLINADKGIEDGCVMRLEGLGKKYPNLIRVPEMVMFAELVGYQTLDLDLKGGIWKDLDPHMVSYLIGWKILDTKLKGHRHVLKVKNAEQLFGLLKKKRIDVALYERWQGLYMMNKLKIDNAKVIEPPYLKQETFMYLNKKHRSIIPLLASTLAKLKQDGTYQTLYDKALICPLNPMPQGK